MFMLTSGTTGRPKGCIKSHKSYLHSCIINLLGKRMAEGGRELLVVPIYYNSGRNSLITQFSFGGTVYLRERFDPTDALSTIQNEKITCLALAPQQCDELLEYPDLDSYDKSSLRGSAQGRPAVPEAVGAGNRAADHPTCLSRLWRHGIFRSDHP